MPIDPDELASLQHRPLPVERPELHLMQELPSLRDFGVDAGQSQFVGSSRGAMRVVALGK
jgi:hypothetical protein